MPSKEPFAHQNSLQNQQGQAELTYRYYLQWAMILSATVLTLTILGGLAIALSNNAAQAMTGLVFLGLELFGVGGLNDLARYRLEQISGRLSFSFSFVNPPELQI